MPSKYKVSNLCVQVIANVFYIECRELLNWYDELHALDTSGFPRVFMCLDSDHMFVLVYMNSYHKIYSCKIKRNTIFLPIKSVIISIHGECYLDIFNMVQILFSSFAWWPAVSCIKLWYTINPVDMRDTDVMFNVPKSVQISHILQSQNVLQ